ncbi:lysylphosphatidylglycerol synthase domain-containing protein [Nocardioides sp. AE5]|uniref:lysylphosphatidylglycerol synthase domain-containing protein n=1 Tax=Nocardioides sp. AE5 TaxID=2962573 RepID=UPI0028828D7B|nr:lysylphosphatidylglycerol synthase domain-containing protein [Nocardioides sp. AE5]MDT0201858.1 lysylphosphatidylglycerol synthase domain-containing protein [Nocardioides sp. AE5]
MTRATWLNLGRVAFVAVTGFFAWWSLRGRWGEVGDALAATSVGGVLAGLALVLAGLVATGFVWLRLLAAHGHRVPVRGGLSVFFTGQLGKYVPGSVWSIGVQAKLARRYDVPLRATVGTGLVFLGFHVATAIVLGGAIAVGGGVDTRLATWLLVAGIAVALVGMAPPVVNRIAAPITPGVRLTWADLGVVLVLMALAWAAYSLALLALAPDPSPADLAAMTAAFALAYAAGVVIVLAPAGLGAREATFVLLLAPTTGLVAASSLAVLARLLHSVADFALAVVAWDTARQEARGSA